MTPWRPGIEHGMGQWRPAKRSPAPTARYTTRRVSPSATIASPAPKYTTSIQVTGCMSSRISPAICPVKITPASTETHAPTSGVVTISTAAAAALPATATTGSSRASGSC